MESTSNLSYSLPIELCKFGCCNLSITKSTPSLVDAAPGIGMCPAPRTAKLALVATRIVKAPATSCESVGVKMHQGDKTVDSDQNSVIPTAE